ncbi:MAG: hypothetical protein R3F59_16405 [Myxococcota bacterium]
MLLANVVALSFLSGCTSVIQEYEMARDLALTDPGAAPDGWVPDASIQLSKGLIDDLLTQTMQPPPVFDGEINMGLAVLTPALTLETLKLGPSLGCEECLEIELGLGGDIAWAAPLVGSGAAGVKVGGRIDAKLDISKVENGYAISVVPYGMRDVGVTVLGKRAALDLTGPVVGWAQRTVLQQLPRIELTEIGTETAPVRGVRVSSSGEAVRFDLLTGARVPGALPTVMPYPTDGFQVDVSTESLLAIARTEAFRGGAYTHGILVEPTRLEFEGDQFVIGIRMWRTTGRGWWRDYEVEGTWALQDGELTMSPTKTYDRGHSRGAALADPLIALGEGIIQKAIGNALDTTVPTRSELGTLNSELVVTRAEAAGGILRVHGTLERLPPSLNYVPGAPK